MKITKFNPVTLASMEYLEAAPRGAGTWRRQIDIELLRVDSLPGDLDALIVTGDLQARELTASGKCGRLLGITASEYLADLVGNGLIPVGGRVGVLLCGDLYTVPTADRRGGLGDVSDVWRAFSAHFAWVVGVLGNHDAFENGATVPKDIERAHLLDGNAVNMDGLAVGGVSGIVGKLSRPNRKDGDTFISLLDCVVTLACDVVLLHESPACFGARRGNNAIREYLELAGDVYGDEAPLVFSGHTYWEDPLVVLPGGIQVLNVDHRLFVLQP